MKYLFFIPFLMLTACTKDKPNVELVQNMMQTPAIKAQEGDSEMPNGRAMRLPPKDTVARGNPEYRYYNDEKAAIKNLKNPYTSNVEVTLEEGKKKYDIYCGICHGVGGKGDGNIAPKMLLAPPTLVGDKIKSWNDQQIFHIITNGRGMMGSYAAQIKPDDRWKIINYVRKLQSSN